MSDLVTRLHEYDADWATRFRGKTLTDAAADEITALRAQLEAVEAALALHQNLDAISVDAVNDLTARAERAEAALALRNGECEAKKIIIAQLEAALATARRDALLEAAMVADALQRKIKHDEADALTWGGPDPRGEQARQFNLGFASLLREMASSIRALANEAPE